MSKVAKFTQRIFHWDLDAYMCFRKKPSSKSTFPLTEKLVNDGWIIREVDFTSTEDLEKVVHLFLEAFPKYRTLKGARCEIESAIKRKDLCFVLANTERFGAMVWLGLEDNGMMQSVGMFIEQQRQAAVDHRSYVSPDFRGFGVQKTINNQLTVKAESLGIEWIYGFVGAKNTASINNCMKAFQEWRIVYHLTIEIPFVKRHYFPKLKHEHWEAT
jgi:hypothetical protein